MPTALTQWFTVARPHSDIREGRLDESVFPGRPRGARHGCGDDRPARGGLLRLGETPEEFVREMHLAAAINWYARGEVSQGKGAEIAA